MEILEFFIPAKATEQKWAVYMILAENIEHKTEFIYVGKVGDNNIGCNPIISRIGNHFSHNKIHSQIRNKLKENTTNCNYRIFYKLYEKYELESHLQNRNKINEIERHLNKSIQDLITRNELNLEILNPYSGKNLSKAKREERKIILNDEEKEEIQNFARTIILKSQSNNK